MRKGISKIKIPIRPQELTIEAVEKYIKDVFAEFQKNATIIEKDYNTYCLDHAIYAKVRAHEDSDVNNIVVIPDLKAMVDWKTGYVFGNPIKYAQNQTSETDDINYLNKYFRSSCQRAVDKEVGTWAYATGVGYYFIEPKSEDFDNHTEAPYVLYCIPSNTCAKVYSSFVGNKPLFDIVYTTYDEIQQSGSKQKVSILDIYMKGVLYTYKKLPTSTEWSQVSAKNRGLANKPLPLVEKRFNPEGIGIVAMGESMQHSIDLLVSNSLDYIADSVNQIIVYKNCNLGETDEEQARTHRVGMKNGCLVLNSGSKDFPADVDTLKTELSLSEVREIFSVINEKFHSSLGVPMEMSSTNSGNTTKSGSEVANGYDNAYNRALDDINTFIRADTELLEKIMWICENTPDNKVNNLKASDIEIKYSLNLTDNILTKTQSYVNLVQTGVPPTIALRLCKLSNDPEAEGKLIDEYAMQKAKEQSQTQADENLQADNNSQE